MIDLKAIAKDAAERVHKNGGCVPQMAFAPILFALEDALSTTPARAEAQDEGAAGDLKPCPFCGGEAEIIHLDDDDNAGGSCVCCTKCQASGNVEFGRKENFVENWNRRAHPSPTPAADADTVRKEIKAWADTRWPKSHGIASKGWVDGLTNRVLAALKSTAAKEGGAL